MKIHYLGFTPDIVMREVSDPRYRNIYQITPTDILGNCSLNVDKPRVDHLAADLSEEKS